MDQVPEANAIVRVVAAGHQARPGPVNGEAHHAGAVTAHCADCFPGGSVPDANRLIARAGDDLPTVRGEDKAADPVLVALEHGLLGSGLTVPESDRAIGAGGGEAGPVRAELQSGDAFGVA